MGDEGSALRFPGPSHTKDMGRNSLCVGLAVLFDAAGDTVIALGFLRSSHTKDMGRDSSVGSMLGSLSCLLQRTGFDPSLRRIFFR